MTVQIGVTDKVFNLAEAREMLPLISAVTADHREELAPIQDRLNRMLSNDPRRSTIEREFEAVVSRWKLKVEQLGPKVQSLWVVEFDVGEGYLCWRYPEQRINFFREYGVPYAERVRVSKYVAEMQPGWAE